jgi:hypothetical protein
MDSPHDVKAWASETTVGRRVYNYDFRLRGREIKGWRLIKTVPMRSDRTMSETTYLWQDTDAPDRNLVRVNVVELVDWRRAQKYLLDVLAHTMRPDLPRGTGDLGDVGDVEFVARSLDADVAAAVMFTRGNIAVVINSVGSVNVDVSEIAVLVDRMLREPPARVPSLRTVAKRQTPKSVQARRRQATPLVRNLRKTGDRWLKVIVPDGEVQRKGDALAYLSPQPGRKTVQIFAIPTGAEASRGKRERGTER